MAYKSKKSFEQQFIESILRAIGWILKLPFRRLLKKSTPSINRQQIEKRWQAIESLADSSNPHELAQSIIMADKLLDSVLESRGLSGANMGDRLKAARNLYRDTQVYQGAWDAHKLRNQIAHAIDLTLDTSVARQNIEKLKKAIFSLI